MSPRLLYGRRLADLPAPVRALAQSIEQSEKAVDRVMGGLAAQVGELVAAREDRPLVEADYGAIMAGVDAALAGVYGLEPASADRGMLGSVIVAECHNARKRTATAILRQSVFPAARKDPELAAAMGLRREELT